MMNPYPDRIAELHAWLESRYGQTDRQATEILLAALLDPNITHRKHPWLIVETDYPSRDMSDAWFNFGAEPEIAKSMAVPRVQRGRVCEAIIQEWIDTRNDGPGLYVDAEWRRLPSNGRGAVMLMATYNYPILMSMCVRLRVAHPRGAHGSAEAPDREADRIELRRLASRVLDNAHRRALGSAAAQIGTSTSTSTSARSNTSPSSPSLFYWCELLQKVAPLQQDWESLVGSLTAIAHGIALLYDDGRPADWCASERVLRDCVPYETSWLIEQASDYAQSRDATMAGPGHCLSRPVMKEMRRLNKEGVLLVRKRFKATDRFQYHPARYRVGHGDFKTLIDRTNNIL